MTIRPWDRARSSEEGFALLAVMLVVVVVLGLMAVALLDVGASNAGATSAQTQAQAQASAQAGLAEAAYEIDSAATSADLPCTLGTTALAGGSTPAHSTYQVAITYYPGSAVDQGETSDAAYSCAQAQANDPVQSALVEATGVATDGAVSSTARLAETLEVTDDTTGYLIFTQDTVDLGAATTIERSRTRPGTTSAPARSQTVNASTIPIAYSATGITDDVAQTSILGGLLGYGSCPQATQNVSLVALGTITEGGCPADVTGSTWSTGNLTWSGGAIYGNAVVSQGTATTSTTVDGDLALSGGADIGGDAVASGVSGDITLTGTNSASGPSVPCPSIGTSAGSTTPLPGHGTQTCVGGRATASGTVTTSDGGTVEGTVTDDSPVAVPPPPSIPFPAYVAPISASNGGTTAQQAADAAWSAAGYDVLAPSTACSSLLGDILGSVLTPVAATLESLSGPAVIVTDCPFADLGLSAITFTHNLAIFDSGGIDLAGTTPAITLASAITGGPLPQLLLSVPSPSATLPPAPSSSFCTTASSITGTLPDLSIGGLDVLPASLPTFFYTPCTFTDDAASLTGEIVAGQVNLEGTETLTSYPFGTIPDLTLPGIGPGPGAYGVQVVQLWVPAGS